MIKRVQVAVSMPEDVVAKIVAKAQKEQHTEDPNVSEYVRNCVTFRWAVEEKLNDDDAKSGLVGMLTKVILLSRGEFEKITYKQFEDGEK